jgi:hypothetical protein
MRRRGHAEEAIRKVVHDNPLTFFRQAVRWQEPATPAESRGAAGKGRAPVTA